jgi:hypothetical protein
MKFASIFIVFLFIGCISPEERLVETIKLHDIKMLEKEIHDGVDINAILPICTSEKLWKTSIPLFKPVKGKIISGFGWRKSLFGYGRDFHTGIDIEASSGDSIKATAPGIVAEAGWNGGYGFTVKISHNNNFLTIYGHCSSLCVKKGQTVSRGDIIAYVGETGNAVTPHCHYEIRKKYIPVNPEPLVTFRPGYKYRCSFLHYAVTESTLSIIIKLVKNGATVNKTDKYHLTPLVLASLHRKKRIVEFLQSELTKSPK